MLSNLFDFISDPDFIGGIAEGSSKELTAQKNTRQKTLDELRVYGLEKTNRLEKEYDNDVDASEENMALIATQITPPGGSYKSQEVLAGTKYLVDTLGVAGAQAMAKELAAQRNTYNINPLVEIGNASLQGGGNLTLRQIGASNVRKPTKVNLKNSGIAVAPTAIETIFGGPSVEEEAQAAIESLQSNIPDVDVKQIVTASGVDVDLLINGNNTTKQEIARFKNLNLIESKKPGGGDNMKIANINAKIDSLGTIKRNEEIGAAKPSSDTELFRNESNFVKYMGKIFTLDTKGEILGSLGPSYTFVEVTEITKKAAEVARQMAIDYSDIMASGNIELTAERSKLDSAITANRAYRIVTDVYDRKSIELLNDGTKLVSGINIEEDENNPAFDPANVTNSGGNAVAYLPNSVVANVLSSTSNTQVGPLITSAANTSANPPNTGFNLTDQSILDAVSNFKNRNNNSPTSAVLRAKVATAIVNANSGMTYAQALEEARKLL